jgi:hypothetical protein
VESSFESCGLKFVCKEENEEEDEGDSIRGVFIRLKDLVVGLKVVVGKPKVSKSHLVIGFWIMNFHMFFFSQIPLVFAKSGYGVGAIRNFVPFGRIAAMNN